MGNQFSARLPALSGLEQLSQRCAKRDGLRPVNWKRLALYWARRIPALRPQKKSNKKRRPDWLSGRGKKRQSPSRLWGFEAVLQCIPMQSDIFNCPECEREEQTALSSRFLRVLAPGLGILDTVVPVELSGRTSLSLCELCFSSLQLLGQTTFAFPLPVCEGVCGMGEERLLGRLSFCSPKYLNYFVLK